MRLVSHLSRAIRRLGLSNTDFADQAGIARSTVQKLIGRDFKEIRIDTIERIAARLGTSDITELFSLQDDTADFFAPYLASKSVTFVFGTHDVTDAPAERPGRAHGGGRRTTVDLWDVRAQTLFLNHVRAQVPDVRDEIEFFSKESFGKEERRRVLELVEQRNVVIVGSPKVNPACEAVLREVYPGWKRDPSSVERGPRLRLSEPGRLEGSILSVDGQAHVGVLDLRSGRLVARSQFKGVGKTSLDGGILLTVFRPRRTKERVCLVVAAGISGCATYGALQGLVDHPPQAQDLDSGRPYERAVQVRYTKPTDSVRDDRRILRVEPVA